MSIQAIGWAWQQDVPGVRKIVLLALADNHNAESGQCNPSVRYLAIKTGLAERTVERGIAYLAGSHHLKIEERRREDGSRTSNQYHLTVGGDPQAPGGVPQSPGNVQESPQVTLIEPNKETTPVVPSDSEESSVSPGVHTKRKTKVTQEFIEEMKGEYPTLDVPEQIGLAKAHKAWRNWDGKQQYIRNWLTRAVKFQTERSPPSSAPRSGTREKILVFKAEVEDAKG